jgi:hypothetical protein
MREQIMDCLMHAGLRFQDRGRYFNSQCPKHDDTHPSSQVFMDGWVNCLGPCGRFHISEIFPSLRDTDYRPSAYRDQPKYESTQREYKKVDLIETWKSMPLIPRDHVFKAIPLEILDNMGWRWTEGELGMGKGYFIPYFSANKQHIPFAQVRHLDGERRFSFLKDTQPVMYGSWNIANTKFIYLVEGSSDGAVMELVGVPWIAAPSSASVDLVMKLADFCKKHGITIIYGGDNDAAGNKLLAALENRVQFRMGQPPKIFKDWGDMLLAKGLEAVSTLVCRLCGEYCQPEKKLLATPKLEDIPEAKLADLPQGTPEWIVEAVEKQASGPITDLEAKVAHHPRLSDSALLRARKVRQDKKLDDAAYIQVLELTLKYADERNTAVEA